MKIVPKTIEFSNEEQDTLVKALGILTQFEKSVDGIECFSNEYYECSNTRGSLEYFLHDLGIID